MGLSVVEIDSVVDAVVGSVEVVGLLVVVVVRCRWLSVVYG